MESLRTLPCPSAARRLGVSPACDVARTTLAPFFHQDSLRQSHLIKRAAQADWHCLEIDLEGFERSLAADLSAAKSGLGIQDGLFPYQLPASSWWRYALAPHSYLGLDAGRCQVGLNYFNRFLHVDLRGFSAEMVDPGVGGECLSTTNWFDAERGELWFASWPVAQTAGRIRDPRADVTASIWKHRLDGKGAVRVWQGPLGDSLHHLALCPDRRYAVLTELGLYRDEKGVVPSCILVLDLQTGQAWRLPVPTAGHVEFDPADPRVCYVSSHHIALVGSKVGIFGPGAIHKFRLTAQGPQPSGMFSRPDFHRITTHALFRHRDRTLMVVTGYPGTIFLVDADTMTLFGSIDLGVAEPVDASAYPHICRLDSYGIAASEDGETLLVGGTGLFRRVDIPTGRTVETQALPECGGGACFTGHLGSIARAGLPNGLSGG